MHKISTPDEPAAAQIVFDDFAKVDIRAGLIVSAEPFPGRLQPPGRTQPR